METFQRSMLQGSTLIRSLAHSFDCILEIVDSLGTPDLNREDSRVIIGEYPVTWIECGHRITKKKEQVRRVRRAASAFNYP